MGFYYFFYWQNKTNDEGEEKYQFFSSDLYLIPGGTNDSDGVTVLFLCKTVWSWVKSDDPREGGKKKTVDVSIPSHLLPAVQWGVQWISFLMKFDIPMMTGAMTALCQDTVKAEDNVNSYKLPHLRATALLLQDEGQCVMEALVISQPTGDTSFSSTSTEVYSQQNNDRCDYSHISE